MRTTIIVTACCNDRLLLYWQIIVAMTDYFCWQIIFACWLIIFACWRIVMRYLLADGLVTLLSLYFVRNFEFLQANEYKNGEITITYNKQTKLPFRVAKCNANPYCVGSLLGSKLPPLSWPRWEVSCSSPAGWDLSSFFFFFFFFFFGPEQARCNLINT